jgi:glucose/arabinose dehydrogenase
MNSKRAHNSRLVRTTMSGLIGIAGVGLVLLAQNPQPQIDKLPKPGTGTPNQGRNVPMPADAKLKVPAGFTVTTYADMIPGARYITVAPTGDLFVSSFQQSTITVLRDANNDGVPEMRSVYASAAAAAGGGGARGAAPGGAPRGGRGAAGDTAAAAVPCNTVQVPTGTVGIRQPQGMAFNNGYLYIANTDGIVRYKYTNGDMTAQGAPEKVVDLFPGGNHSWRNVIFNAAGTKMYVSVGSASNNDAGEDCRRAAILEFNPDGSGGRIFASGIRNPEGMAWQPGVNNVLWTAVNERDNLGDNLVPDYITSVKDGGFYGWPYSYLGRNYDPLYVGGQPDLVKKAIVPDVLLPSHSAAVGLMFYTGTQFPQRYRNGAFVGLHGSWNRSTAEGYKVIFVPFANGKPGPIEDFLTGFVVDPAMVTKWGRPVGVTMIRDGSLLVGDDAGNKIWQIKYTGAGR